MRRGCRCPWCRCRAGQGHAAQPAPPLLRRHGKQHWLSSHSRTLQPSPAAHPLAGRVHHQGHDVRAAAGQAVRVAGQGQLGGCDGVKAEIWRAGAAQDGAKHGVGLLQARWPLLAVGVRLLLAPLVKFIERCQRPASGSASSWLARGTPRRCLPPAALSAGALQVARRERGGAGCGNRHRVHVDRRDARRPLCREGSQGRWTGG